MVGKYSICIFGRCLDVTLFTQTNRDKKFTNSKHLSSIKIGRKPQIQNWYQFVVSFHRNRKFRRNLQ